MVIWSFNGIPPTSNRWVRSDDRLASRPPQDLERSSTGSAQAILRVLSGLQRVLHHGTRSREQRGLLPRRLRPPQPVHRIRSHLPRSGHTGRSDQASRDAGRHHLPLLEGRIDHASRSDLPRKHPRRAQHQARGLNEHKGVTRRPPPRIPSRKGSFLLGGSL